MKRFYFGIFLILASVSVTKAHAGIVHNHDSKTIVVNTPDSNAALIIDYSDGCKIAELKIKGKNALSPSGVYTGFRTRGGVFSSLDSKEVEIQPVENGIRLRNIDYGDKSIGVSEVWEFSVENDKIIWNIERAYDNAAKFEEMSFPQFNFSDFSVWKGGILDNGGVVWCKYLSEVNDTYGVHTGGVTLWNPASGDALRIVSRPQKEKFIATRYSRSDRNEFTCTQSVTDMELEPRYGLSRFVHGKSDVFAPFNVEKEKISVTVELEYVDYSKEFSRGNLVGIDADAVRELLNTTGRYGVVDNGIVGANGWTTNWKCLHEPFFSQIGLALNDRNYTHNMMECLNRERDYAVQADGRVLSRWHNGDDDQMPGTYNYKTGYYEACWGYTVDSQTGYVINVAELFNLLGDLEWLRSHKDACEKALDWLIRRDSNDNGLFEMMNGAVAEQKASDWLDIVWASFENAFVNAQMYEALNLWTECESLLGDSGKSDYYLKLAARLKTQFNKSVDEGGFWSDKKKQYVYWRDNDGSIHGDNLVTPVNFAAIAFGLCDNPTRKAVILNEIEKRMKAEKLFHWPLCFDSYKREEVSERNWPFPTYENGDIFPTWGYLGVRAYAGHDRNLALGYINNLLQQYRKDGLSYQRYSRVGQEGRGSDILAGICTSITALYSDIYGIRPKWNRLGLEPHMTDALNGTAFTYNLRDVDYKLQLSVSDYRIKTDDFSVECDAPFGVSMSENVLTYFHENKENLILTVECATASLPIHMIVRKKSGCELAWSIPSAGDYAFTLKGLRPDIGYKVRLNGKSRTVKASGEGTLSISEKCSGPVSVEIRKK